MVRAGRSCDFQCDPLSRTLLKSEQHLLEGVGAIVVQPRGERDPWMGRTAALSRSVVWLDGQSGVSRPSIESCRTQESWTRPGCCIVE